ncbi:O-antigen ligase family protein [Sporosarcina sp. UB5]|uniref:O-antigen ligase family protein n=1 Tax=Sporosarcina sp. UB5 TaxID=3047463 RepID=UPI003D7993CC
MKKLMITFISTGLLFTNFTGLRLWGPVGLGELLLLISSVSLLMYPLSGRNIIVSKKSIELLLLIASFFFLMTVSTVYGLLNYNFVLHDYVAFLLSILLISALAFVENSLKLIDKIMKRFYLLSAGYIIFLIIYVSFISNTFLGHNLLYYNVRMQGFSTNPNQLALLMVIIVPFSLYFLLKGIYPKLFNVLVLLGSLYVSLQTYSDALYVAILCGGLVFSFCTILVSEKVRKGTKIIILLFLSLLPFIVVFIDKMMIIFEAFDKNNDQASIRLILWKNGLKAFTSSPFWGNGTGAHSGVTGPFMNFESHNSFIDFISMFGLLGLLIVAILFTKIVVNNLQSPFFLSVLFSILTFSMFHNTIRQPLVWFFFTVLYLGTNAKKST